MQVCTLEQHLSCLSHPPSLVNIILLSVFMNLTFVDSSYDIIQDLAFSVWHFTWHDVLKVHWCCHKRQDVLPEYSRLSSVWLHIHMPYLCPFIYWRTRTLLPYPDTAAPSWAYGYMRLFKLVCSSFSDNTQAWNCWVVW